MFGYVVFAALLLFFPAMGTFLLLNPAPKEQSRVAHPVNGVTPRSPPLGGLREGGSVSPELPDLPPDR
jgi:hypothetical protein